MSNGCKSCKYSGLPIIIEPCANCWGGDKWESPDNELDKANGRIAELEAALDLLFVNLYLKGDSMNIKPGYAKELMDIIEDVLPKEKDQDE